MIGCVLPQSHLKLWLVIEVVAYHTGQPLLYAETVDWTVAPLTMNRRICATMLNALDGAERFITSEVPFYRWLKQQIIGTVCSSGSKVNQWTWPIHLLHQLVTNTPVQRGPCSGPMTGRDEDLHVAIYQSSVEDGNYQFKLPKCESIKHWIILGRDNLK